MTTVTLDKLKIVLICEVDEMWSFVMGKKLQRWLWYAWEPRLKRIIAHALGDILNVLQDAFAYPLEWVGSKSFSLSCRAY